MATNYAYPYKVLPNAVAVEVAEAEPEVPFDGHRFDLRALTEVSGSSFSLSLKCSIPTHLARTLIGTKGNVAESVQLAVRERSIASHRRTIHVAAPGDLDAKFELEFDIDSYWGKVDLEPVLLLVVDADDDDTEPGLARAAGSILAWGSPLSLLLDSADPFAAGGMLDIEWRNFDEDAHLPGDALHALELKSSPKLLLNSASAAAYDVLRSEATHGTKARLRDVTFGSIASDVWTTLIRTSYASLRKEAALRPDAEPLELLEELQEWQRRVLEAWSPVLLSEDDADVAVSELCEAAKSDDMDPLAQLDRALQKELSPRLKFEKLAEDALGD